MPVLAFLALAMHLVAGESLVLAEGAEGGLRGRITTQNSYLPLAGAQVTVIDTSTERVVASVISGNDYQIKCLLHARRRRNRQKA